MKVVSPREMGRVEALAYAKGASELEFMERAGAGIAHYVEEFVRAHHYQENVVLVCGKAHNAGDAFVAGRYLLQKGFEVTAIQTCHLEESRPLCRENAKRFIKAGGFIHEYHPQVPPSFPANGVILDGIFGTGFHADVQEPYASLIRAANTSGLPILAVDIPSGLDAATGQVTGECIKATETIFLGLPKTGFFLLDGWNYVGRLRHVDFGLTEDCLNAAQEDLVLTGPADWRSLLPSIPRNRHKYQSGYVVGLAGSEMMPGAAVLSSFAALRGGAGIVKLLSSTASTRYPVTSPPEIIHVPYDDADHGAILQLLNAASATFIGPGLGQSESVHTLLGHLLPNLQKPAVIDADALTFVAQSGVKLPPNCVLTPHRGEMARLLGHSQTPPLTLELLQTIQQYVETHQITLVLKGGPSFIFHPQQPIRVSTRGDPGMAKAGTGDVLTGLLAALLAQGLSPCNAAILGVALHGMAGECVVRKKTSYGLVASDITEALPQAYGLLCQNGIS